MASRRRLIAARMIVFRLINDSVDAPAPLLDSRFTIRALRLVPRRALVVAGAFFHVECRRDLLRKTTRRCLIG